MIDSFLDVVLMNGFVFFFFVHQSSDTILENQKGSKDFLYLGNHL